MNVLIISTNRNKFPAPVMPVGACMVAGAAAASGHRVSFLDLMFEHDPTGAVRSAIERCRPEVIGVSIRNIDNNDMRSPVFFIADMLPLMAAIRGTTGSPVILGGAALSVMPAEILAALGANAAVPGDGEVVFPKLLDRLAQHMPLDGLEGIVHRTNGAVRMNPGTRSPASDVCPTVDYRHWVNVPAYQSHLSATPVQTKQGCQFQCVYCTYGTIEGPDYRLTDPASVADTVTRFAAAGQRDIEFVDSVFNAPYDHAMAVCESLARVPHGARLQSIELNPLCFDDALLLAMERAGFIGMGLTVESASDTVLQGLRKGFTSREVHRAAETLRRHRLPCAWMFLLGGPGETRETVHETLRFAEHSIRKQDVAFFTTGIRVYPGTELETIARKQGVLMRSPAEMLAPVFYVSPEVEADWMINEVKQAMGRHMNFINADTLNHSLLPAINRLGYGLGLRSPLWRYTRFIRRGLRMAGMDA